MGCQNCFNGCPDTTSDQCVKYTGETISALGIESGDSLAVVEQAITDYLINTMNGDSITPVIDPQYICALVGFYLPSEGTISLVDILTAIIRAICSLQDQITNVADEVATLNSDYYVDCLIGVSASSDTHNVVQCIITRFCELVQTVSDLSVSVGNEYLKIADVNAYIENYITNNVNTKMYSKMVPYAAVEFYGDRAGKFDNTGAGIGDWEKVYLCNGQNNTPDKRGRIPVGTTVMGNTAFHPAVDPATPSNPTYDLNNIGGQNTVALTTYTMPSHVHANTVQITPAQHTHDFALRENGTSNAGFGYAATSDNKMIAFLNGTTNPADLAVSINNAFSGGGNAHNNIPPVLACHYIMYIP